ncbi:hypothetical protein EauM23_00008 [Exiguobacterium phage vB_EauM-23]|nr:hypothetical protein EauM23_00008 [Exiguobacterium phage vB_EauM-23]
MNLDMKRHKAIDVEQAAILLIHGHKIFNSSGNSYHIDKDTKIVWMTAGELMGDTHLSIQELLTGEWYAKKPFDVRQEMFERPNEWVAAYNDERGKWIQVGFDSVSMRPIKAYHGYTGLVEGAKAQQATSFELDNCLPIEDVPEEATR